MRRPRAALPAAAIGAALAALGAVACVDASHDAQVAALGGEPNGSPSPTHRPGQPCNVCHGGQGPAKLQFSVAGTVTLYASDYSTPAQNAVVQIQDATGSYWHVTTNPAGNFFILQSDWAPVFPIECTSLKDSQGNGKQSMISLDNRDGSCNGCHTQQLGPNSAGPIFVHVSPDAG